MFSIDVCVSMKRESKNEWTTTARKCNMHAERGREKEILSARNYICMILVMLRAHVSILITNVNAKENEQKGLSGCHNPYLALDALCMCARWVHCIQMWIWIWFRSRYIQTNIAYWRYSRICTGCLIIIMHIKCYDLFGKFVHERFLACAHFVYYFKSEFQHFEFNGRRSIRCCTFFPSWQSPKPAPIEH